MPLHPNQNIVNTYAGTIHFTTSDPSGATLPADYTFTPADHGVHTFVAATDLFTAGTKTITVTDTLTGINSSATVIVKPAPAAAFAIAAPASSISGSPFDITVTAQDPYGNTDISYQGTITFTSSDIDPAGVLPGDYTFQDSDKGQVTFPSSVTLITPGDQTVTAMDPGSGISGSAVVTVSPGPLPPPPGTKRVGGHLPVLGLEPSAVNVAGRRDGADGGKTARKSGRGSPLRKH